MSVAVRALGLHKTYQDGVRRVEVLSGADLLVEPGEIVAVVGPSGSGKSTLLHLLGALDRPDSGTVEIGGQRLEKLSGAKLAGFRNRTIGFVFQFHQLLPDFTALENVMLPGRIAGLEPPLLLADEPTGNLDPASGEHVFNLLLELQARHGTTAVLVTHNPGIAERCTRTLLLDNGLLVPGNNSSAAPLVSR